MRPLLHALSQPQRRVIDLLTNSRGSVIEVACVIMSMTRPHWRFTFVEPSRDEHGKATTERTPLPWLRYSTIEKLAFDGRITHHETIDQKHGTLRHYVLVPLCAVCDDDHATKGQS